MAELSSDTLRAQTASWFDRVPPAYWVLGAVLLVIPAFVSDFIMGEIFARAFIMGIIALSLMFLGGYGGMVSLAQMAFAGFAGYMMAVFGTSAITDISQGWPWWVVIPLSLILTIILSLIHI